MYDFLDKKKKKGFSFKKVFSKLNLTTELSAENVLLALLLLSIVSILPVYNHILDQELEQTGKMYNVAKEKLRDKKVKTSEIENLIKEFEEKQQQIKKSNEVVGKKMDLVMVFKELELLAENEIWLKSFEITHHNNFEIKGSAINKLEINKAKETIEKSNSFKNVILPNIQKRTIPLRNRELQIDKGKDVLNFTFEGKLNL